MVHIAVTMGVGKAARYLPGDQMKMERQMLSVAYDIKTRHGRDHLARGSFSSHPSTGVTEVGRRLVQYDTRINSSFQTDDKVWPHRHRRRPWTDISSWTLSMWPVVRVRTCTLWLGIKVSALGDRCVHENPKEDQPRALHRNKLNRGFDR